MARRTSYTLVGNTPDLVKLTEDFRRWDDDRRRALSVRLANALNRYQALSVSRMAASWDWVLG